MIFLLLLAQFTVPLARMNPAAVAGSFTYKQSQANYACSGTTCAVTMGSNVAAGDLLAVMAPSEDAGAPCYISSVAGSPSVGTFTAGTASTVNSMNGWDNAEGIQQTSAYVLSASAATTPTITATFNQSCTGGLIVYEFSYTGSPAFDGGSSSFNPSSPACPSITTSSGNDLMIQSAWNQSSVTAISGTGYTGTFSGQFGFAYNTSTTNSSPTWTNAGSYLHIACMAFGFGVTAPNNLTFVAFSGTAGNNVTVANVQSNTHGTQGGQYQITTAPQYAGASFSAPLNTATGRMNDGSSYASGTGGQAITWASANYGSTSEILRYIGYTGSTQYAKGTWFCTTVPNNAGTFNVDLLGIYGAGGTPDFVVVNYNQSSGTNPTFTLEGQHANGTSSYTFAPGNCTSTGWYYIALSMPGSGSDELEISACSGTAPPPCSTSVLATITNNNNATAWGYIGHTELGNDISVLPTGYAVYFAGTKDSTDSTALTP